MPYGPLLLDTVVMLNAFVFSLPAFYDSLLAKLMVHGSNRTDATSKLKEALQHTEVVEFFLSFCVFHLLGRQLGFGGERGEDCWRCTLTLTCPLCFSAAERRHDKP
jgi:hypothetical protein